MINFLTDVLQPIECMHIGMTSPRDRMFPVTTLLNARNALACLRLVERTKMKDDIDRRILCKLYGALFALYPELMEKREWPKPQSPTSDSSLGEKAMSIVAEELRTATVGRMDGEAKLQQSPSINPGSMGLGSHRFGSKFEGN